MGKKLTGWKTKGMNRDLSVSAFNPEFAFENINLRLSTNEGNTLMSWVNEKGTTPVTISGAGISGIPIGTAVINNQLVLFTTTSTGDTKSSKVTSGNHDYIWVLSYSNADKTTMSASRLYNGNLNFSTMYPLETLVSYESEFIQKVYWTDGVNQPRMINIAAQNPSYTDTSFDFIREIALTEQITVQKKVGATGTFASGVIQYAFTYYNKHGQESNIFYVSHLQYISPKDRGGRPDEKIDNAFLITIKTPDTSFDYLRIYSIQRTSLDGTPIVKRIQDIYLKDMTEECVSYLDTGTSGDSVDPMDLLYKGGELITAETLEQKDNTLFLGNINLTRPRIEASLRNSIKSAVTTTPSTRQFWPLEGEESQDYPYINQLTSFNSPHQSQSLGMPNDTVPCAGFKQGETYRLGVQFQHKSGKWSDPIYIDDKACNVNTPIKPPRLSSGSITVPCFDGFVSATVSAQLIDAGYRRVRALVVFPTTQDRSIICQGVVCPTMYTDNHRNYDADLYAQSSWFFRFPGGPDVNSDGSVFPSSSGNLKYTFRQVDTDTPVTGGVIYNPIDKKIRSVEIEGNYDGKNEFVIDNNFVTYHSPDIEFDTQLMNTEFLNVGIRSVGTVEIKRTLSDISLQTETPTASSNAAGFIHKSFIKKSDSYGKAGGIVSGLFYEDYCIDDYNKGEEHDNRNLQAFEKQRSPMKWLVYLWNANGSLNNDINRPADRGIATAVLKKKVVSNLRFTETTYTSASTGYTLNNPPQLFSSDEPTIEKLGSRIYRGNIDTVLTPDFADGKYFAFDGNGDGTYRDAINYGDVGTSFTSEKWWKTFAVGELADSGVENHGLWKYFPSTEYPTENWERRVDNIGNGYNDLVLKKSPVRMKYKSTPHMVLDCTSSFAGSNNTLKIIEITRTPSSPFGGTSPDALRENKWIPCGDPQNLKRSGTPFYYLYGDTYFQRWDCLKTYPFTFEDPNQVVEIGSFMLETRVNIDGRYDRNRGQHSNLNMSPLNFNLINPVYSQQDNFFTYRILDDDFYTNSGYPNQITWSKTKNSGADVDVWANVTLASILELDGDKGQIRSLNRFNDQLIAFQDTGVSRVLYNENVMISTDAGVPVEIANSQKVTGKNYISNTVGCSNKWSIANTPAGLYFMDSHEQSIYLFNVQQLTNLSTQMGFNSWTKKNIPAPETKWTPNNFDNFISHYDKLNQDVYFINKDTCLAYSEKLGAFTSFYNYENTPYFCNLSNTGLWIRNNSSIWKHQVGDDYCKFFGTQYPFSMTLVGNPEPQTDKIFTNLEFRAVVEGEGTDDSTPYLPFNTLETWDEYQHGITTLSHRNGHSAFIHHSGSDSSLKRKFRIWRCDIPRDNAALALDEGLDITRFKTHPNDRMRNPWIYLKLMKSTSGSNLRTEIHDIVMTYFG